MSTFPTLQVLLGSLDILAQKVIVRQPQSKCGVHFKLLGVVRVFAFKSARPVLRPQQSEMYPTLAIDECNGSEAVYNLHLI